MNQKLITRVAKKLAGKSLIVLIGTAMEDQGVAVTDVNIAKVYVEVLEKIPNIADEVVESMINDRLLKSSW